MAEPRKLPKQARARATFDAVIEAAARILEADEMDALTTNHIADRAGVSIGSLYQYFPSREVIVQQLIRRERAALAAGLQAVANRAGGKDWPTALAALIDAAVAHQLARPKLARALEYLEFTMMAPGETDAFNQSNARLLTGILSHYGFDLPAVAAQDLAAIVRGMADAAGLAGETDRVALAARISAAAGGYIRQMSGSGA